MEIQVARTHLPVQVKRGASVLRAGGLSYDGKARVLDFTGPVRASLEVPRK